MKNNIIEFIKSLGSYYDFEKDKIYGCKKGSWVYIHEEGHRKQRKIVLSTKVIPETMIIFTLIGLVSQNYIFAQLSFAIYLSYLLGLEFDSYAYMFWVWRNRKNVKKFKTNKQGRNIYKGVNI